MTTNTTPDLIREMQENVAKYGRENTTTFLMVQAINELQRLHAGLAEVRRVLVAENEREGGPITDTIWRGPSETLLDYIDNLAGGENTTPSGADALLQLIESYVEKRHTHGAPQYNVVTARARDAVLAALSAAQDAPAQAAQAVPQGWVMVPKEPTPEMLQIGRHAAPYRAVDVYRAMLAAAPAAPQSAAQQGWDIDAAVEKAWGRFQVAMDKDEPLPPPSVHAAAHYGTWLGREAHRHDEPRAGAFRNAARMLAVLESEVRRLHAELLAAQAQEAAPAQGEPSAWHRIEEDAEVDVPLDTDLLLAWWDEWSESWKIEANYAGSERGGWRHGRATHWMPLPAPPSAAQQKGASNG